MTQNSAFRASRNAPHHEALSVVVKPPEMNRDNSSQNEIVPLSGTSSQSSFSDMVNQAILDTPDGSGRRETSEIGSPVPQVIPRRRSLNGMRTLRNSSNNLSIRTQNLEESAPVSGEQSTRPVLDLGPVVMNNGAASGEYMKMLSTPQSATTSVSTISPSIMLIPQAKSDDDIVQQVSSESGTSDDDEMDVPPPLKPDFATPEYVEAPIGSVSSRTKPTISSNTTANELSPLPKTRITQDFLKPDAIDTDSSYEIQVSSPFTPDSDPNLSASVLASPSSDMSPRYQNGALTVSRSRSNSEIEDAASTVSSSHVNLGLNTPQQSARTATSSSDSSNYSPSRRNQVMPFATDDDIKDVEEIPQSPSSIDAEEDEELNGHQSSSFHSNGSQSRKRKSPLSQENSQRVTTISKFSDSSSNEEIIVKPQQKRLHNKPSNLFFFQQRFPEVPSAMCYEWHWMSINFAILFLISTIIGIAVVVGNNTARERVVNYSNHICRELTASSWTNVSDWRTDPRTSNLSLPQDRSEFLCQLDLHFEEQWEPPIYVHYELSNFFQSHRDYAATLSDTQLGGKTVPLSSARTQCKKYYSFYASQDDASNLVVHPCGALAHSMFNDTFILFDQDQKIQVCNSSNTHEDLCTSQGIVYGSQSIKFRAPKEETVGDSEDEQREYAEKVAKLELERETYFNLTGLTPDMYPYEPTHPIPQITDEFREWIRPSPFPKVVKAHRIITTPLYGNYTMYIHSVFPVHAFGGEKQFVFRTLTWTGSANVPLAVLYFIVAAICGLVSLSCVGIGVVRFIKYAKNNTGEGQGEMLESTID